MSELRDIEFRSAAKASYGKNWQWRLAVARNLNLRTVQTWAAKPTEKVPELVYDHVRTTAAIIRDEGVGNRIATLVQSLRELDLSDHVIAAQLHAAADELSDPSIVPQGAPRPKAKNPSVRSAAR